ncbi:hypothetical protein HW114_09350 [Serratia symbiotica]|uniref:hypothetical protein n=1 Tax=Serratia symbiotica TaxID=138074 RepID=UPI0018876A41|nr:hypothetical protein [Serratia symbiotica]MBF1995682.1 hypothetical protein [Serratia symbiotica]
MATETETELANVVLFPVKDADPIDSVGFIYEKGALCAHPGIYVNEPERQCRCKKCGAVIAPFDYLLSIAKRETRLAGNIKALRDEERYRRVNIAKLIQVEKNAKARIRRAQKNR